MKKVICFTIVLASSVLLLSGCYSCKSYHNFWGTGPVKPGTEEYWFFDERCQPVTPNQPKAKAPEKQMVAKAEPKPAPMPAPKDSPCGENYAQQTLPSGGVIKVEKSMPSEVNVNQPFEYQIKVSNLTDMELKDVTVTEMLADNFKMSESSPKGTVEGKKAVFKMPTVGPKQSKVITIKGSAVNTDCIKTCATVSYTLAICANVNVVEPAIMLTKQAPSRVLLCEEIPITLTVKNTGTGMAEKITITDNLVDGLMTSSGAGKLNFAVDSLEPGESKTFRAMLKAEKTGNYKNSAMATADGGLQAKSGETTTKVVQPVLEVTKEGPGKQYLGREVTYKITVKNTGDADATELVLTDTIPPGVSKVRATGNPKISGSIITWNLGTLAPGQSRTGSVTYMPNSIGRISNTASAMAECAEGARDSAETMVSGIAAVLLEVIDISDPVAVGDNETYEITATNQGSMDDTNIRIVCELEENMQYVSSSGATAGSLQGNKVVFTPLKSLAPKAKAKWTVRVKAVKAGNVRFKVTMNTDEIGDRPVEETEATNFYE